jgi:hypothetical protein
MPDDELPGLTVTGFSHRQQYTDRNGAAIGKSVKELEQNAEA